MRDERETRALQRLVLQRARVDLKLARLRKRQRTEDTARKFRLGAIGARFGWQDLPPDEFERCTEAVRRLVADVASHDALRARDRPASGDGRPEAGAFVPEADVRAERRDRLALGARLCEVDPDGTLDPRVVAGAVALVDERRSMRTDRQDDRADRRTGRNR